MKRIPFWQKGLGATGLSILFNTGLRGSTLVLRFALSFYIVKFMGLEAAGIYGLALASSPPRRQSSDGDSTTSSPAMSAVNRTA